MPGGDVQRDVQPACTTHRGPQTLMVWEDARKTLGPNLHVRKKKNKAPVAHWDNKTTEEEKEEDAGWEESAASLIISEKTVRRKTLPIGTGLINKVLSERNPGQKRMVRFNIPQRLSSKLKPRLLNASEIIIMRARVTAGGSCLSLTVDVCSPSRRDPLGS